MADSGYGGTSSTGSSGIRVHEGRCVKVSLGNGFGVSPEQNRDFESWGAVKLAGHSAKFVPDSIDHRAAIGRRPAHRVARVSLFGISRSRYVGGFFGLEQAILFRSQIERFTGNM